MHRELVFEIYNMRTISVNMNTVRNLIIVTSCLFPIIAALLMTTYKKTFKLYNDMQHTIFGFSTYYRSSIRFIGDPFSTLLLHYIYWSSPRDILHRCYSFVPQSYSLGGEYCGVNLQIPNTRPCGRVITLARWLEYWRSMSTPRVWSLVFTVAHFASISIKSYTVV